MTTTLPDNIRQVFDRFVTTEYTTINRDGQPITWPVIPYHDPAKGTIDITTGLGYPKKARDAQGNSRVSLLFSDPTGSGLSEPPAVLVQGTAEVDDRNLDRNRKRYREQSLEKLPGTKGLYPPEFIQRHMEWYFTRIYVYVRPERVLVWPGGDAGAEPELLDSHMEEVRSAHDQEPVLEPAALDPSPPAWDERIGELGSRYPTAVVSIVGADGFPLSARVPVTLDRQRKLVRLAQEPAGIPLVEGRACVCAHKHHPDFKWQLNFQARGNLVRDGEGWALAPTKLVGGFELPPSRIAVIRDNASKAMRYRKVAKREMERLGS